MTIVQCKSSKQFQTILLYFNIYFKLIITGWTGTYKGNEYSDKPIARLNIKKTFQRITQKIKTVVKNVIRIAKSLIHGDDCTVTDKQTILDIWAKKAKQIMAMTKEYFQNSVKNGHTKNPDSEDQDPLDMQFDLNSYSYEDILTEMKKTLNNKNQTWISNILL